DIPARAGALALRGLVLGAVALVLLAGASLAAWTGARAVSSLFARIPERWRARLPLTWALLALVGGGGVLGALVILLPRRELFADLDGKLFAWAAVFLVLQIAFATLGARLA